MDRGRRDQRDVGGPGDGRAGAECDLAADSRADLPGHGAVLSLPGGGSTGDDGRGPFRAGERLDLAWTLAGALQPGHLRLLPPLTTVHVRRGGLLPDDRVGNAGPDATSASAQPLGDGASLLRGATACRRRALPDPGAGP